MPIAYMQKNGLPQGKPSYIISAQSARTKKILFFIFSYFTPLRYKL